MRNASLTRNNVGWWRFWTSGRLGKGMQLDPVAKLDELCDKTFGFDLGRAAIEMAGAKILELNAVPQHVIDRDEQGGGHGTNCLLRTAPAFEVY